MLEGGLKTMSTLPPLVSPSVHRLLYLNAVAYDVRAGCAGLSTVIWFRSICA